MTNLPSVLPGYPADAGAVALSVEELRERVAQGAHDARGTRAANTDRTYATGRRAFENWCRERGEPAPFPVPPRVLAAFVDDMGERVKPATVETYVHAINGYHRLADLPAPGSANVVRLALQRLRRGAAEKGVRQKQAAPMRRGHVDVALGKLGARPMDFRDAALVALAYDTLARASDLVALNVGDVRPEGPDAVAYIARSKTDQEGEGDFRFVARDTFARVVAWVEAAGLEEGEPLFVPMSRNDRGDRLTRRDVARIYKRRVGEAFSAHSTRVGGAIDQRAAGITTGQIAQAGGLEGRRHAGALHPPHLGAGERGGYLGAAAGAGINRFRVPGS